MASKNTLTLDDRSFDAQIAQSAQPLLVDFGATWCAPCKAMLPLVEELADAALGELRVAQVDVDDAPGIAKRFGVRSVPTLVVLRNGVEVARHVGTCNREQLRSLARTGEASRDDSPLRTGHSPQP